MYPGGDANQRQGPTRLRDVPWDIPIEAGGSSPGSIYRKKLSLPRHVSAKIKIGFVWTGSRKESHANLPLT